MTVITIDLKKEEIDGLTDPEETGKSHIQGLLNLYKRVVPHYDWCELVKTSAVVVSKETSEYIISRLVPLAETKQEVLMLWLNHGFSVMGGDSLPNWKVRIDMDRLVYKKED